MYPKRHYTAVAMGASWGGLTAYTTILSHFHPHSGVPVFVIQHQKANSESYFARILSERVPAPVISPEDKTPAEPGKIYVAPPGYHMLVDKNREIAFSLSAPVHYSRPSIDEFFYSAADVYGEHLIVVLLTGANEDGAAGLAYAHKRGAYTVVQSPETAEQPAMPLAGINTGRAECILSLDEIGDHLIEMILGNA